MSEYMGDLSSYFAVSSSDRNLSLQNTKANNSLDMTDFLTLMVAQFQNQSIDNTADTTDMLNQLVQMQMVTAITNITDATVMMYAGSLVGKEVTLGQYNSDGKLEEIVGTVTGTGTSGGQQVIFVNGQTYYLNEIMAVGRLPDMEEAAPPEAEGDETPPVDSENEAGTQNPDPETPTVNPENGTDVPVTPPESDGETGTTDPENGGEAAADPEV